MEICLALLVYVRNLLGPGQIVEEKLGCQRSDDDRQKDEEKPCLDRAVFPEKFFIVQCLQCPPCQTDEDQVGNDMQDGHCTEIIEHTALLLPRQPFAGAREIRFKTFQRPLSAGCPLSKKQKPLREKGIPASKPANNWP